MALGLTPAQQKAQVEAAIAAHGGTLPPVPDGPVLPAFDALALAQALDWEVRRADAAGHTKIRIDMGLEDATEFARQLRRLALIGG